MLIPACNAAHVQIAAHEVRRVVPHPAPAAAVAVAAMQVAADGTAEVQTAAPHPFSGAKQLASLAGLPGGLNGHYPVAASDRRKSQLLFRIKLPRLDADAAAALQQAVAGGGATVRWVADAVHNTAAGAFQRSVCHTAKRIVGLLRQGYSTYRFHLQFTRCPTPAPSVSATS